MDHDAAIGIFDSGLGGLTVARAILDHLPHESIIYVGDTARVPYGVKSARTIARYATEIVRFLRRQRVKLLIVACNSMAAVAREAIESAASGVPVLDVLEAGAEAAVSASSKQAIAVIGTAATIESGAYARRIAALAPQARVVARACPLFVPLVEEGFIEHPATELIARDYLAGLAEEAIDVLVLGCTHYPLLKAVIARVVGGEITLVDSATAVAERAAALLDQMGLHRQTLKAPQHRFVVTDQPPRFQTLAERFLARSLPGVELVTLDEG